MTPRKPEREGGFAAAGDPESAIPTGSTANAIPVTEFFRGTLTDGRTDRLDHSSEGKYIPEVGTALMVELTLAEMQLRSLDTSARLALEVA